MKRRVLVLATLLVAAVLAAGGAVAPAVAQEDSTTSIDSCGVLDQDGKTYVLESNLTVDGVPTDQFECLNVDAENVVFDGQGHTLAWDGTSDYTGIFQDYADDEANSVEIRNLTLEGWNTNAIQLRGTEAHIHDVTVQNVANSGIDMYPYQTGEGYAAEYAVEDTVVQNVDGVGIDAESDAGSGYQEYTNVSVSDTTGSALAAGYDQADDVTHLDVSGTQVSMEAYRVNVTARPVRWTRQQT